MTDYDKMLDRIEAEVDDHIVIRTMRAWLDGEPVWPRSRIIEEWGGQFEHWQIAMFRDLPKAGETGIINFPEWDIEKCLQEHLTNSKVRDRYIEEFGFAIPCAELLDELAKHDRVLEVGAGTGYMTKLMRNRGIPVDGSDLAERGPNGYGFETGRYDPALIGGTSARRAVRLFQNSTVFCSWPTLNDRWFYRMLNAMQPGQQLVVIREDATAEEKAWNYLDSAFDEIATIDIPTFEHMNDYASVHIKKRRA